MVGGYGEERHEPQHDLERVKELAEEQAIELTQRCFNWVTNHDLSPDDVRDCLLELKPSDFRKSMLMKDYRPGSWGDVYVHHYVDMDFYIKLILVDDGAEVFVDVPSFKWDGVTG